MIKMRIILGALISGVVGFAAGYFGKCSSGTCPLTGNPVISNVIGALLGVLIAGGK